MVTLMRHLMVASALLLVVMASEAHAQLPGQPRSQPPQRIRTSSPGYAGPIALDTVAQFREYRASMGVVFTAANEALKELDIPIAVRDSAHGLVGSLSFIKMRRIAGRQMSAAINCGTGMTGLNADSYRITLATMVMLEGLPNGNTKAAIALVASGQDIQGASKEPVACGTSGLVENQIEELIRKKLNP